MLLALDPQSVAALPGCFGALKITSVLWLKYYISDLPCYMLLALDSQSEAALPGCFGALQLTSVLWLKYYISNLPCYMLLALDPQSEAALPWMLWCAAINKRLMAEVLYFELAMLYVACA